MGFEPTTPRVLDRGFESHLGLRFFLCPLMVDSLHLPLFPLNINISGIGWLVINISENVMHQICSMERNATIN